MKSSRNEISQRLAQERIMLAKGCSWETISAKLRLSIYQAQGDRKRLAKVLNEGRMNDQGDAHIAYEYYRDVMMYAVYELQQIIDDADSTAYERVMAIKTKVNIIDQVFSKGVEIGVLLTHRDDGKFVMEETKRLSIEGRDLVGNVIERFRNAIPVNSSFIVE